MRKIVITLAAIAAVGTAIPVFATSPADARSRSVVVIKKSHHYNNGRHLGWYKHRHHNRRVHHGHGVGARVIIR